jgi:hypothetical protein
VNEEALAHWGLLQKKENIFLGTPKGIEFHALRQIMFSFYFTINCFKEIS